MAYALIINNAVAEYPFDATRVRSRFPDVSFPATFSDDVLASVGVVNVQQIDQPAVKETQALREDAPKLVKGVWTQQWAVDDLSPAQISDKLAQAKAALWAQAKVLRDAAVNGGCDVDGLGRFDTDLISRTNLSGAVVAAIASKLNASPISIAWKLADNTIAQLDGQTLIASGLSVVSQIAAIHETAQSIGHAIQGAASLTELAAIDINQGWPK
jgi:hypothetical protein